MKARRGTRPYRFLFRLMFGAVLLVTAFAGAIVAIGASGMGTARFEIAARSALSTLAGEEIDASFRDARLTWRGPGLMGLELRGAELRTKGGNRITATTDRMQFGIKLSPLLAGEIRLSGVKLSGLKILVTNSGKAAAPAGGLVDKRGLIDPDRLVSRIFSTLGSAMSAAGNAGDRIQIADAEIAFSGPGAIPALTLKNVDVIHERDGYSLAAESRVGGIVAQHSGHAIKGGEGPGSLAFEIISQIPQFRWDYTPGTLEKPFARTVTAEIDVRFTGTKSGDDSRGMIESVANVRNLMLETVKDERQRSSATIKATLAEGSGKLEIDQLVANIGQASVEFHGAIQPAPPDVSANPVYRYELVSDGSRIAAADSPERTVGVLARLAGILDLSEGRMTADEIRVRTNGGEVIGNAAIVFPGGKTPAVFLAITVPNMPVPHAKQLWPWKAADGARSWVLANVFGGEVRNSRLEMSVVAGRFGDGEPFRPDEIFGHFEVYGTRFDTAGEIPPVRDANGTIDFQGTDVQITLSSGTAYLPSGRTVDAANGAFNIDAAKRPLIGALEIDVAGNADAVAELATFEPIRADRFVELKPEDFSGSVSGHVSGNIPLQKVPDPDVLTWHVALDYENLDVSKPFGGQTLTAATGTIVIDPNSATIDATGKLNDLPAEIVLVEPFEKGEVTRKRDIRLQLDNKARAKISPALNTLLSGPIEVDIADSGDGPQRLVADLTRAELHFPWAGWSKGAGIPAKVSFTLEDDDDLTRLADIRLAGKSFSLDGSATLRDGQIEKARFGNVTLNRGDLFDLSVERNGGSGYRLAVSGKRIDARSLIRQFLADPDEAGEGLDNTPIRLTAKADQVLGFGNETVSNVEITYTGTGTRASGVRILATTDSGKKFAVSQGSAGNGKTVEMQSADAGAILRFLNIYGNMQGGSIDLRLAAKGDAPLRGQIDARDFWIVNEPRLEALVATAPQGDSRSLNQVVKREIDVSKAKFEQGFARIEKGNGYLSISDGVLRGPLIGSTFQGQLYDANGLISMTGTFMPAYGLNRLFADIPLVGLILGNGRDRGLIGITYKLSGDAKSPRLQVNPISAIAPGIFRKIFEFR